MPPGALYGVRSQIQAKRVRTEWVLVESSIAEKFENLCASHVSRLRQGPPSCDKSKAADFDVGVPVDPNVLNRVTRQITTSVQKGARVVCGGQPVSFGDVRTMPPTLVSDVTPTMPLAQEETFGPVLPLVPVEHAEEAINLANNVPFGLAASVWTADKNRGRRLADALQTGSVCINDSLVHYFCVEAPLGGIKNSGMGFRHSRWSLRQFCWPKTHVEDHPVTGGVSKFVASQITFPYRSHVLKALRALRRIY